MLKFAITGGIACGKSSVGSFLQSEGVSICDSDELAHQMLKPDSPVYAEIIAAFGREICGPDGEISRRALGEIVFSDRRKLEQLNRITHPEIRRRWEAWLTDRASDASAAVIVPLLFEIGGAGQWDAVVCVASPEQDQIRRLRERGLSESQVRARLAAQLPLAEKMRLADFVIFNCGTMDLLREQTKRVWRLMVERKHGNEKR